MKIEGKLVASVSKSLDVFELFERPGVSEGVSKDSQGF